MKSKKVLAFFLLLCFPSMTSWGAWVWSPESGKFINTQTAGQSTADEEYDYAMKLYKERNLDNAAKKFEDLLKSFPDARVASEAQYRLGVIYEEKGDYLKAFKAYKKLIEYYPQSERFSEVIEREFRIGNLFLSGKKGKLMGVEILPSLPRAVEIFEHIVKQAPYSEYGDKAQFHLGLTYKKWGQFAKANEAFEEVIQQYPQSELAAQARFQLAETSFMKSANQFRDQRALDEASANVDRYLTRYPDARGSEMAAKLRQQIDEKNAEKNYRIGLYYEKQNYLDSARIYYDDLAKKYPHTKWGQKAAQRVGALKDPAKFITSEQKSLENELQIAETKLKGLPEDGDKFERQRLERQVERLEKKLATFEKDKNETLKRRQQDIDRRRRELKEKFKRLELKKKAAEKNNPSPDFQQAMDRWYASLLDEREELDGEQRRLEAWREELGVREKRFGLDLIPFIGEGPGEMEQIRRVDAKKLFKLSEEKKDLLEEKETLYKQHGEVKVLLSKYTDQPLGDLDFATPAPGASGNALDEARREIRRLENELDGKRKVYEKQYGTPAWVSLLKAPVRVPTEIVKASTGAVVKTLDRSIDFLNPFDGKSLEDKNTEELLERRMHLKEKIASQQTMIQTLSEAFDAELALQEQKRLVAALQSADKADPRKIRRSVKKLEKEIRKRYQEIEDGHDRKKEMLDELDQLLKEDAQSQSTAVRIGRAVTKPAVWAGKFTRTFLFGMPNKDVELTQSAQKLSGSLPEGARINELRKEIELESLLIDAKNEEIFKLRKQLELVKAQASLAGGFQFRSSIVTVPYRFLSEAIKSAKRIVPEQSRDEILINRLDEETRRLEEYKTELTQVNQLVSEKTGAAQKAVMPEPQKVVALPEPAEAPQPKPTVEAAADQTPAPLTEVKDDVDLEDQEKQMMQKEIKTLMGELKVQEEIFEREKRRQVERQEIEEQAAREKAEIESLSKKQLRKRNAREGKLRKELREIEKELIDLITKEAKLQEEETSILEKRIEKIDKMMPKVRSRVISQDLITERDRLEQRVSQLEVRRDFLSNELKRFQPAQKSIAA